MEIITGKIEKTQRVVVYGPEGIGKSSLAAQFPDPVFIDTEGSTNLLDVARTPAPKDWDELIAFIKELAHSTCGTVVLDTADWAERLAKADVCEKGKKASIEDYGYGKGYVFLAERWNTLLEVLQGCVDNGKHVVVVAHSMMRKFEQPDEMGAYDRYELKLVCSAKNNLSAMLKEWADMVLFFNYRTMVVENEVGKKKAQGGKRTLFTSHTPSWDAKNRHDLPSFMVAEKDVLPKELAAALNIQAATKKAAPAPAPAPKQTATKKETPEQKPEAAKATIKGPEPETKSASNINPKLEAALLASGISAAQLKEYYVEKGFFTDEMEVANLPDNFISAMLGKWENVTKSIKGA